MKRVKLEARYCPEVPDDVRFSRFTPWGDMTIGVDNPTAAAMFVVGEQYYIDIQAAVPS